MTTAVGTPSMGSLKGAAGDYAVGLGGGLVYGLGSSLFGSGLVGSLLAALLAGSIVKGTRGEILATMAGFQAFAGSLGAVSKTAAAPSPPSVM